jgi:maltose alpha-D-glucosyltransferase/alpha-amylase
MRTPSSLLNWTKEMLALRRAHPAFGLGTFNDLGGSNSSVLSFVREHGSDVVLCIANLSKYPQATELDLSQYDGWALQELRGGAAFTSIGAARYSVSIGGHGFYWLKLVSP